MGVLGMTGQEINDRASSLARSGVLQLAGQFLMMLSAPAAIWMGVTMWAMNAELSKLNERVQIALQSPYNSSDAARDMALRIQRDAGQDVQIQQNRDSIKEIRDRLRILEQRPRSLQ